MINTEYVFQSTNFHLRTPKQVALTSFSPPSFLCHDDEVDASDLMHATKFVKKKTPLSTVSNFTRAGMQTDCIMTSSVHES